MRSVARQWKADGDDDYNFYLTVIQLSLTSFMFLLNFFADKITDREYLESTKPCPNSNCSFLSRLFYLWVTPLLWRGYRRPLSLTDLWDVSPQVASRFVVPQFAKIYDAAVGKFLAGHDWVTVKSTPGREKTRKEPKQPQVSTRFATSGSDTSYDRHDKLIVVPQKMTEGTAND